MRTMPMLAAERDAAFGGRIRRAMNMAEWARVRAVMAAALLLAATAAIAYAAQPSTAPGTVTAWGYNGYGQLGNGTTTNSSTPVSVIFPPGVTASAIDAGSFHSLAITNNGLYAWGATGEVGSPTTTYRTVPVKVIFPPAVTTVSAIAAGGQHSLAITDDGLYAWGYNGSGQLGDGTMTDRTAPVKVIFPCPVFPCPVTTVSAIAAGEYHSLAITNDGLYAWGNNGSGELGDGTLITPTGPVKVDFPSGVTALAISGGGFHSLAITTDGVYAWGNNTFGQLGDGTTTGSPVPVKVTFPGTVTTVTGVAAGFWHSLVITNDGVYGFGYNGNGELGVGTTASRTTPVKVTFPQGVTLVGAKLCIAAGAMHSLAITDDGLYAWGNNSSGQLGMVTNKGYGPAKVKAESNDVAVAAGYYHSLALH